MKNKFLILSLAISASAFGASIDHIQTYSPDYLANQAQNGMINNVSAYYNPAGVGRLEEGKYVHAGLQYAFGNETMSYAGKTHKANLRQAIPNMALYSVDDKGAYFATFGGIAGGGDLKYNGVPGLNVAMDKYNAMGLGLYDKGTKVEGSNRYEQLTLGRAFNIDDKLSVSVAGRVVHGTRELKGTIDIGLNPNQSFVNASKAKLQKQISGLPAAQQQAAIQQYTAKMGALLKNGLQGDIDVKREAWGYGFQLGIDYKATEKLNLAARYDSRVKLNFKSKGSENQLNTSGIIGTNIGFTSFYNQYMPGTKTRRDLPAILALGASYKVTDKYTVSTAANYYFNKDAKMDRVVDSFGNSHGRDYKNGWEIALGNEYQLNDKFTLIGSINYAKTGAKASSYSDVEYAIDSTTLGAGVRYKYDETLDIAGSVAHFIYNTSEGTFKAKHGVSENQKYKKSITAVGISLTKKF